MSVHYDCDRCNGPAERTEDWIYSGGLISIRTGSSYRGERAHLCTSCVKSLIEVVKEWQHALEPEIEFP